MQRPLDEHLRRGHSQPAKGAQRDTTNLHQNQGNHTVVFSYIFPDLIFPSSSRIAFILRCFSAFVSILLLRPGGGSLNLCQLHVGLAGAQSAVPHHGHPHREAPLRQSLGRVRRVDLELVDRRFGEDIYLDPGGSLTAENSTPSPTPEDLEGVQTLGGRSPLKGAPPKAAPWEGA